MGHKLFQECSKQLDTYTTIQQNYAAYPCREFFAREATIDLVDAQDPDSIKRAIAQSKPDVIVNCIGVVKQLTQQCARDASITINASFPHSLAKLCSASGIRLITIGTDCVFSGKQGNYQESCQPDPIDCYGHSKLLGEVAYPGCLTLRTSIIGRQLVGSYGMLEWLLSKRNMTVSGYRQAIFSGFTTQAFSQCLLSIITKYDSLEGIWHVSSQATSKYDLLCLLNQKLNLNIEVLPDDQLKCNRSLNSQRFQETTGWSPPSWTEMVEQLLVDPTAYDKLRANSNSTVVSR